MTRRKQRRIGRSLLLIAASFMASVLSVSVADSAGQKSTSESGWTMTARMPEGRKLHTATLLADGRVLVASGCIQDKSGKAECPSPTAVVYDPVKDRWTRTGPMSAGHMFHTAGLLSDGRVLVAAGCTTTVDKPGCPSNVAEIYDPATNKWQKVKDLDAAQANHAMAVLPAGPPSLCGDNCGKALVIGSVNNPNELYDPKKDAWQTVKGQTNGGSGFSATTLQNGTVLTVGGLDAIFNPLTTAMEPITEAPPTIRLFHSATLLKDGRVLMAGGLTFPDANASSNGSDIYVPGTDPAHPAQNSWLPTRKMHDARVYHRAALLADGRVLAVGGRAPMLVSHGHGGVPVPPPSQSPSPSLGRTSELFDPQTQTWTKGPDTLAFHGPGPEAQPYYESHIAMTVLKDGRAMVIGGVTDDSGKNIPQDAAEIFGTSPNANVPTGSARKGELLGRPIWQIAVAAAIALVLLVALFRGLRKGNRR